VAEPRSADGRRRLFWPVLVLGVGAGAATAVAAARPWGSATAPVAGQLSREVAARGTDVAPLALALALVALAAWGTVLVLRRRARRVMAVVGLLAALGVVATLVASYSRISEVALDLAGNAAGGSASLSPWFVVCLVSAVLEVVAFGLATWLLPAWPEMAARYDAPGGPDRALDQTDLWKALDEGHDPTV
jgi:tryptophan-associated transmembrane protein